MPQYESGAYFSSTMPQWQRTYYEGLLLDTIRTKSIMVPYCVTKEDFAAKQTGIMNYTEVYDTEPNWNPLSESNIWLTGTALDSRSVQLQLEIHGDMLKFSDYQEITNYINAGDIRGLVREKMGQNLVDNLDILARNAFLQHPYPVYAGGTRTSRATIAATDYFLPDYAELARTHLEEKDIPGLNPVSDEDIQTIMCVTTPRVIHDIRTNAAGNWLAVEQYAGNAKKFSGEVGMWNGVRFVRSNRMVLRNHGAKIGQCVLVANTVVGQGAAASVDTVYAPGQNTSTRTISVQTLTGTAFAVGDIVTIHAAGLGAVPLETDGTQETRRIVSISGAGPYTVALDKPLLKPHAANDYFTKGVNIHASIFMGGPAVVLGIGERPTPILPPKFDDLMMINRVGWRGFFKFQMFRPEFVEVHLTSGTTN